MDVDAFLRWFWGINTTREYSRLSHNTAASPPPPAARSFTINITITLHLLPRISNHIHCRLVSLHPSCSTGFHTTVPVRLWVPTQKRCNWSVGGVSPTLFPSPCTQLSMHQSLSTSTALPAPLPCVDGQWHKVHRSPGSPPAPVADLLHSYSPLSLFSCFSCLDLPRPHPCPPYHRRQTLKRTTMNQEGFLHTPHHLPHHPHRCTHPLRGCQGRRMYHRPQRRSSGATCGAATTIYKGMCAGGNCSPTRNSSFALTRKEKLMAPKVRMIHTVSKPSLVFAF